MATYTKEKDVETVLEDDIEARNTMQEVFSNTARWPGGFGGFTADVVANINGEEQKGTVTVKESKDIAISIEEEKIKSFLMLVKKIDYIFISNYFSRNFFIIFKF